MSLSFISEMKAPEIRKILKKKKKILHFKILSTDDPIWKKKARKKYVKIKTLLTQLDDYKLEYWFRKKNKRLMLRRSINQRVQEWINTGHLFGHSLIVNYSINRFDQKKQNTYIS